MVGFSSRKLTNMGGWPGLHDVMADVAASLSEAGDLEQTLDRITRTARDTVPGADYASISVRHSDGRLETLAATDPLVVEADALQYELREGPCYDAVTDEDSTYCPDLSNDSRWPRYGPKARDLGLASQLAFRLAGRKGTYTGLNLYSGSLAAFNEPSGIAGLFSSHAKVALGYAEELDTLKAAVATRQMIGEAIGIVMERFTLTEERAFEFLIRLSQTSNVKLRNVATEIVRLSADASIGT